MMMMEKKTMDEFKEFYHFGKDILSHPKFQEQRQFIHHKTITLYDHSIEVAFRAYLVAKKLKLDTKAVVRGALLHDFFLYDWHVEGKKKHKSLFKKHGFTHARVACDNAEQYFDLTRKEKDIIIKHMFPLNIRPPRYLESWVVNFIDDYTSIREVFPRKKKGAMTIHEYVSQQLKKSP